MTDRLESLDLPTPREMRGRWAALAAVLTARGWGRGCAADRLVWHYDDGGGNWLDLHHLGDGRAVLVGHDHEYSETYYGKAAEYFEEEHTDLLAGAPDWWAPPVREAESDGLWVGFVYGFDAHGWRRARYDADDGFESVGLPAVSENSTRKALVTSCRNAPGLDGKDPEPAAVDSLMAADAHVTEQLVTDVVGSTAGPGEAIRRTADGTERPWDPAAGATAARAFLLAEVG